MLAIAFREILLISVMATVLIAIICFIKFIFREKLSAAWHYYIWLLLVLRLIIPYTPDAAAFALPFESGSVFHVSTVKNNSLYGEDLGKIGTYSNDSVKGKSSFSEANISAEEQERFVKVFDEKFEPIRRIPVDIINTGSKIWAIGAAVFALYILSVNIIMRKRIHKATVSGGSHQMEIMVSQCCRQLNIRKRIPVIYQNHVKAPALFGLIKPRLLMPADTLGFLDEHEVRLIIIHELCHYKNKDIFIGLLLMVLNIIHWFNPFLWIAFRKINEDREPVCDMKALACIQNDERRKYANTLVKVLEIFSGNYLAHSTAGIMQGRAANMAWRLKLICNFKSSSVVLGALAAVIISILSFIGFVILKGNIGFAGEPVNLPQPITITEEKQVFEQGRGKILDRNGIELVKRKENGESYYPFGSLASHVIGYLDSSGKGAFGIESVLDSMGEASGNVTLTIDKSIQEIAEDALETAMNDFKPSNGASTIILDPSSGEILAMVSKPDFDLNNPLSMPKSVEHSKWQSMNEADKNKYFEEQIFKNKAISQAYEPASTFKTITAAAGLEEGIISPDIPVDDSTAMVGKFQINCWKPNGHGKETFAQALYNSCNPVFVRLGMELGKERFYKYVKDFGFRSKTGINIPGEAESLLHRNPGEIDMAAASFGQRFLITPIQLAAAYGAVANGGNLMKSGLVKEVSDGSGRVVKKYSPEVLNKPISKQTSDKLKDILEGVVSEGTGKNAYIKGYRIAGKTGTSETVDSMTKGRYIASFAGFAPADNPKIVCLVVLDGPQVNPNTGGMTAAPVAGRIMKETLDYIDGGK